MSESAVARERVNITRCCRIWSRSSARLAPDTTTRPVARLGDQAASRRHHRHRHVARAGVHQGFRDHPEWKITVVAAYKGGSPDFPVSANRVEGFAKTIQTSTASSWWTASRRCSPRSTSCCSRASTAGRTWRRPRPCSRRASGCSSTSRWPRASRTRGGSWRWRSRRARRSSARSSVRFHPDIPRVRENDSIGK